MSGPVTKTRAELESAQAAGATVRRVERKSSEPAESFAGTSETGKPEPLLVEVLKQQQVLQEKQQTALTDLVKALSTEKPDRTAEIARMIAQEIAQALSAQRGRLPIDGLTFDVQRDPRTGLFTRIVCRLGGDSLVH